MSQKNDYLLSILHRKRKLSLKGLRMERLIICWGGLGITRCEWETLNSCCMFWSIEFWITELKWRLKREICKKLDVNVGTLDIKHRKRSERPKVRMWESPSILLTTGR